LSLFNELKRRNVLRVAAAYVVASWLIIQVVETLLPAFGFGDAAVRIASIVLAIGLIPALVFAWAFEITPEGLKKEKDVDRSQSISPQTGKKLDRMIMVALALALGYFAVDKFVLSPQRDAAAQQQQAAQLASATEEARQEGRNESLAESYGVKSIAVLAFVDMSPERDQEYFSDGISEELLNLLAKIPELRVASRTSAFAFKGKNLGVKQIGKELNVTYVLEGSVRKVGQEVRITAQLIDAGSDTHVFSETYDITLDNIFAVQDEIAEKIVDNLRVTLLSAVPKVKQVDPAAYELFLKGIFLNGKVGKQNLEGAVAFLEQSTQIDSGYAPAWVSLGVAYRNQAQYGYRDLQEGTNQARRAIERALALDPTLAHAWSKLAAIQLSYDWDFDAAQASIQRSLELEPNNYSALSTAAGLAMALGDLEKAIKLRSKALEIEPLGFGTRLMLGWDLMFSGRTEEAEASLQELLKLDWQYPIAHLLLGQVLLLQDRPEEALIEMNLENEEEWKQFGIVLALDSLGRHDEATEAIHAFSEQYGTVWIYQVAVMYAHRNNADAAFEWLERARKGRDSGMILLASDPFFANIREDTRWNSLLDEMGIPHQTSAHD
jgi:TolB-like protein/Flp pilus assembly protein TadD